MILNIDVQYTLCMIDGLRMCFFVVLKKLDRIPVAGARRRGEYSTFLNLGNVYGTYLANVGRQENIVFYW